jgi:PAS domain S-box-containing protein
MRNSAPPPARRAASQKLLAALNRHSLKSLLVGSNALIVLFCALAIFHVQKSKQITFGSMDSLITVDNVITDLCLKSTAGMIDVRRLEKDFLLNYHEFGFDEARSRYITRLATGVAEISEHMRRIRSLAGDPETARQTREVESALGSYRAGVETLVEKLRARGYLDSGDYGALRAEALAMERLVAGLRSDALLARLLAVRRAEKNFIERTQDADAVAVRAALEDFRAALDAARPPAAVMADLRARAERYRGHFERYVRGTEEIRVTKKGYLRSVQAIDPVLETLYVASLDRVAAKRRSLERSSRLLGLPVIAFGAVVLVVTALFSLVVALTVTRSVVESTSFAERIAAGDFARRLEPGGRNEFFQLAASLNGMAERLHADELARRNALDALQESAEKYRSIVETSTDWIWAIDLEGRHTYTNDRVRDILGIEPEELLRASALELLHPEDVPRVRELLGAARSSGAGWQGVVLRWRHRDGTYRWIESNAVAARDARGALAGFRGVDRDISERRRLEEELVKTQKLEAIGTLAGGIAHDFNNLLQGLFGYISLARLHLDQPAEADAMLGQAERALDLSVNLTTQLLTFAKGGAPLKSVISLPEILEDPVRFALSGSRSDYRITLGTRLWAVDADAGQVGQVLQNLALNASEAMPRGGTVAIDVRNEVIAPGSNPLVPAGGDFVRIDVSDTGVGIPGRHLARIFDPYFTTKQRGSGLGLATSYSIVRSHNGFIEATSRPGEGSVFSVFLPAFRGGASLKPAAVARIDRSPAHVLVMDDEAMVRDVAAKLLGSLGHTVTTAADGEEAVALFRAAQEEGRPFDVVLLDLTVRKGMGGDEAIRRLLELDPHVKAVVSSGYSDAAVLADYRSHGFVARLAKPYQTEDLRACLEALLEPSSAESRRSPERRC